MDAIDIHGVEITGADHRRAHNKLLLYGDQDSGVNYQIIFVEVEWWELCSFGRQNVLSSIECYSGDCLPGSIVVEHDLPEQYQQSVEAGERTLFILNAVVGLSGWIIADDIQIETSKPGK